MSTEQMDSTVHASRAAKRKATEATAQETTPVTKEKPKKTRKKKDAEVAATEAVAAEGGNKKKKKKKKKKLTFWRVLWRLILICVILGLIGAIAVGAWAYSVIKNADPIDTSDISSMLQQSSMLYDDKGEIFDTAFSSQNRVLVELNDVPMYVRYAFIDLEDKTFETHHGFNYIRMVGAVKDAVLHGSGISGTSTITQQLARNLYLQDTMSERSLNRKLKEAYYTTILEKTLTKDEILEGYLNTINFGMGYGIATAARTYFDKEVKDLTIAEAAALAAMPQAPSRYALVQIVDLEDVTEDMETLIYTDSNYGYVWNNTARGRINDCLRLMLTQGHITQEEYDEALQVEIKDMVKPNMNGIEAEANYFGDYVIEQVIADLQTEYGYSKAEATNLVYNGGLRIYTTLDSQAQQSIIDVFANNSNFPSVKNYNTDSKGNILYPTTYTYKNGKQIAHKSTKILLYKYSNYFDSEKQFTLKTSEFTQNNDGSITIKFGGRLAFYNTTVNGQNDISIEFRNMFSVENGTFYSIPGGYLNIPQKYKSMDDKNNVTISADFFTDHPSFFTKNSDGSYSTKTYALRTKVVQPQAAMTIIENETGAIKAMVGGRSTSGRMLFNRATAPRQPGSSIKPLAVYSAAIQQSAELAKAGIAKEFRDDGFGAQNGMLWGRYMTAGSIIDDEPTTIENRQWPVNFPAGFKGLVTMRYAMQESLNVCAVKIVSQVGVNYSYQMVEKYGITSLQGAGDANLASLAMGGMVSGTSTLEMASAYTTFVNDGIHKSYYCYDKVTTRSGSVLLEPVKTETRVLDAGVAFIMRSMLQTVVQSGTGSPAKLSGTPVGGKTGTTSDRFDIWFDGITPKYTAVVWCGNDVNIPVSATGGGRATKIWHAVMSKVENAKGGSFHGKPSNVISVTIDTKSGLRATDSSTSTYSEYFIKGTEPTEYGSLYATVEVCNVSGLLATEHCHSTTEKTGIQRPYIPNEKVKDLKSEVPHEYCEVCANGGGGGGTPNPGEDSGDDSGDDSGAGEGADDNE